MGSHRVRQLDGGIVERAFPFYHQSSSSSVDSDDDSGYSGSSTQGNTLNTATDDSQTISTSIALGHAVTETLDGDGDTLSLVVVSTVFGSGPVTTSPATSRPLPTISSSSPRMTSIMASQTSQSTLTASAGEATRSSSPTPYPVQRHHDNDLSKGELAAAIVVPIVVVLALTAFLFLCFRRRKQQQRGERSGSLGAGFIPASIKEKWSSMRTSDASTSQEQPIVTSTQNNAYNTGLDTSSHGSGDRSHSGEFTPGRRSDGGTTFVHPPPPYNVAPTLPQMRQNTPLNVVLDTPREPPTSAHPSPSPLSNIPHHHQHTPSAAALLAMPLDPPQPSSRSARSITSTLYSDTASVHSARAARLSVGGPHMVQQSHTNPSVSRSHSGSGTSSGDPFDTEANTPVTPLSTRPSEEQ